MCSSNILPLQSSFEAAPISQGFPQGPHHEVSFITSTYRTSNRSRKACKEGKGPHKAIQTCSQRRRCQRDQDSTGLSCAIPKDNPFPSWQEDVITFRYLLWPNIMFASSQRPRSSLEGELPHAPQIMGACASSHASGHTGARFRRSSRSHPRRKQPRCGRKLSLRAHYLF